MGKFISDVFLCTNRCFFRLGEAAVKAERSEFILNLYGSRSQP